MSDQQWPARNAGDVPSIDDLMAGDSSASPAFTTVFRGYDRDEVDAALADLLAQVHAQEQQVTSLDLRVRQAEESADASAERLREELDVATARRKEDLERVESDLIAAKARADDAEGQVHTLTEELRAAGSGETAERHQFEEVLRVGEEQAAQIVKNASVQGDRLLDAAREDIESRRADAQADADAIRSHAEHDARQVRLTIDTELTAHRAQIEREAAHAAEMVVQAEREAAVIRTEAEKAAASLRSLVERETALARAEAAEVVRELRLQALEFEESLTRRQDDAQQEFLVLHNQAVQHAERITHDANEQVAASVDHAQRVQAKADDFDRLMRAQARQIEADARIKARERLERADLKSQKIIDTVTAHSQSILRDAEDRTRQLRWQQHQLTSFMAEVRELIRPEGAGADDGVSSLPDAAVDADVVTAESDAASEPDDDVRVEETEAEEAEFTGDPGFVGDEPLEDEAVSER